MYKSHNHLQKNNQWTLIQKHYFHNYLLYNKFFQDYFHLFHLNRDYTNQKEYFQLLIMDLFIYWIIYVINQDWKCFYHLLLHHHHKQILHLYQYLKYLKYIISDNCTINNLVVFRKLWTLSINLNSLKKCKSI